MGGQGNSNSLGLISNNLVAACVIRRLQAAGKCQLLS